MNRFELVSPFSPQGDQPAAIEQLALGLERGEKEQVLLGVTGSGKTFSIAKVVERVNRPTLVLSHNKTLAAQLFQEFRSFFPHNAVEYFVSYQLYNAASVGIGMDGRSYFYNNPLACRGGLSRAGWYLVPCCPPTSRAPGLRSASISTTRRRRTPPAAVRHQRDSIGLGHAQRRLGFAVDRGDSSDL